MSNPAELTRLDVALVERGLAESRTRAARLIEAGNVRVDDRIQLKSGHKVSPSNRVEVTALERWVSRAAQKLLAACERWSVDFRGRIVLDVGASTGGFTEVALARGASTVVALDVGHGQLHPTLRSHHRVVVREGVNARELSGDIVEGFGVGHVDDVVMDVSFISITQIVPALVLALGREFRFLFLVKPQFEVGKGNVKEGVVRDAAKRDAALLSVCEFIADAGLPISGVMASPVEGEHGNREAIVYGDPAKPLDAREWRGAVLTTWGG